MENKNKLLAFLNSIEFQQFVPGHELSYIETYSWMLTGIDENYPATSTHFKAWKIMNNYLAPKVMRTLDREAELWGNGHRNGTQIEIAQSETIAEIKAELESLEEFFKTQPLTEKDLDVSFFSNPEKENSLIAKYDPRTELDDLLDREHYTLPLQGDYDDYDLDKNPMIESKT